MVAELKHMLDVRQVSTFNMIQIHVLIIYYDYIGIILR